jgi:uncharacterized flavoprotein (TIGR03862 family)
MLAATLDTRKFEVFIYEKNQALGRKFLVAGKGGFNLTHSESSDIFYTRYTPPLLFRTLLQSFSNTDLTKWFASIGIRTYTGSSKRIFPEKGTKPIAVLNAIVAELTQKGVTFYTQHEWKGWNEREELLFSVKGAMHSVKPDITVFALGGSSWKVTGSDGSWTSVFKEKGVPVSTFQPSNCAVSINWPKAIQINAAGFPLKNISLKCLRNEKGGEVIITQTGLEGGAVYALSPEIRQELNEKGKATLYLDLKPVWGLEEIGRRIRDGRGTKSFTKHVTDQLRLDTVKVLLLKNLLSKETFLDPLQLASKVKNLPLEITSFHPIDNAISTVGGIPLQEIDEYFQFKKIPNHYAIGEMLDWDAPTGGYLLQGCFSMGHYLASYLNTIHS